MSVAPTTLPNSKPTESLTNFSRPILLRVERLWLGHDGPRTKCSLIGRLGSGPFEEPLHRFDHQHRLGCCSESSARRGTVRSHQAVHPAPIQATLTEGVGDAGVARTLGPVAPGWMASADGWRRTTRRILMQGRPAAMRGNRGVDGADPQQERILPRAARTRHVPRWLQGPGMELAGHRAVCRGNGLGVHRCGGGHLAQAFLRPLLRSAPCFVTIRLLQDARRVHQNLHAGDGA